MKLPFVESPRVDIIDPHLAVTRSELNSTTIAQPKARVTTAGHLVHHLEVREVTSIPICHAPGIGTKKAPNPQHQIQFMCVRKFVCRDVTYKFR